MLAECPSKNESKNQDSVARQKIRAWGGIACFTVLYSTRLALVATVRTVQYRYTVEIIIRVFSLFVYYAFDRQQQEGESGTVKNKLY